MLTEQIPAKRSEPYKQKRTGMMRYKFAIRSKVVKYHAGELFIEKIWRPLKFVYWRIKWGTEAIVRTRHAEQAAGIDVNKIFRVSPQKIVFTALQEFGLRDFKGQVIGGDWDQLDKKFDSLDLFVAIKQVCQQGHKWVDTIFYQRCIADLNKGQMSDGCHNQAELDDHCRQIEELYRTIQQGGYKSQKELLQERIISDRLAAEEEVAVSIGRYGDLLFSDGAHRLAIAKLLAIPEIPVKVAVRHTEWVKFRNELSSYGRDDTVTRKHELYQPATHPDIADFPAAHTCEPRFQIITENLSVKSGHLLDIGANLGYFCHRFEELGYDCYAVENHSPTAYFLKRLARAENRSFKIFTESIFDTQEVRNTYFDVVLALNIFHHFIKTRADYEKLMDLLNKLHMGELFFESPSLHESQMDRVYTNYSPEEFVDFIMMHTGLKNADFIGMVNEGRPIYKIY